MEESKKQYYADEIVQGTIPYQDMYSYEEVRMLMRILCSKIATDLEHELKEILR